MKRLGKEIFPLVECFRDYSLLHARKSMGREGLQCILFTDFIQKAGRIRLRFTWSDECISSLVR